MPDYKIVEKKNPHAVHGYFDSRECAEHHLQIVIPVYVVRGYFSDKKLKAEDFKVLEVRS